MIVWNSFSEWIKKEYKTQKLTHTISVEEIYFYYKPINALKLRIVTNLKICLKIKKKVLPSLLKFYRL